MSDGQIPKSSMISNEQWVAWMKGAQAGDREAYQQLLLHSQKLVRNFLRKKLNRDNPHIEDVAQEVLIAIHKAKHTFDTDRPYTNWLYTIARYKYIDYLRRWSRTEKNEMYADFDFDAFMAPENHKVEIDDELHHAISTLPKKQRETVEMLNLKGLSIKEVAAATGATETAIRVSAHRAYKRLRKMLTGKE